MDNECNNSEVEDLNKTITNVEETSINSKTMFRSESPVFKCFNQHKTKRVTHCDSSYYDIPSYQINQSVKRRTSGKQESETSDSILPFSPGFSPIPTFSQQFQPPSFHSLGTVTKLGNLLKTDRTDINSKSLYDGKKKSSVFESLGMMDKDISWISSMATPPPQVPGSGFNTIEKATFFPEENFKNIQPRALFSPTHDEDFGCKPLSFSSESEEDPYKTDIRLSDVCATLKQLEVRSLEQMPNFNEETLNEKNNKHCETSPVIKMRTQKKLRNIKTKRKQGEKESSELDKKCESSMGNNIDVDNLSDKLKSNEVNNVNSQSTNFIDDDSFQSISFTCIDELCKTLANTTEQSNKSTAPKTFENDYAISLKNKSDVKSISKADTPFRKQFYNLKVDSSVFSVSSLHNLHSYAQALENTKGVILKDKVIDRSVAEKGVVRLDAFAKGSSTSGTVFQSESSIGNNKIAEKLLKTENDESSNWDTMSKYLSGSQLNMSDSEMFKTVEKLEKTLGSQECRVLGNIKEGESSRGEKCEVKKDGFQLKDDEKVTSHVITKAALDKKYTTKSLSEARSSVASNSVPKRDLVEKKQSSSFQDLGASSSMGVFCTGSGKQIQVSGKALEKAKLLMVECEEKNLKETSEDLSSKWIEQFQGALENSLSCDKIKINRNNKECLGLSDVTVGGSEISISEILSQDKELLAEFSKSHESFQNVNISAVASSEPVNGTTKKAEKMRKSGEAMFENTNENVMVGFSTASGTKVKITEEALEKAKELMANCEQISEDMSQSLTKNWIQNFVRKEPVKTKGEEIQMGSGFSTASGNKIKITDEALDKAKVLMSKCNESLTEECQNLTKNWLKDFESKDQKMAQATFSTASGTKVKITEAALQKAKELMANCDQTSEDMSQSLTKNWMQNFVNKEPVKTKLGEAQIATGFSTVSGDKVVFGHALNKAKAFMSKCDVKPLERCEKLEGNNIEDIVPDDFEIDKLGTKFSTASGNGIKVSVEALNRAKSLMSKCDESSTKTCELLTKNWMEDFLMNDPTKTESDNKTQTKISQMCFSTASGSKVTVSEEALKKARESLAEVWSQDVPEKSRNPSPDSHDVRIAFSTNMKERGKDSERSFEAKGNKARGTEGNLNKTEVSYDSVVDASLFIEGNLTEGDWEEMFPSWLHVYNTSPSLASDRVEMSPVVSHEDGKSSNPAKEYIVKSPVLGLGDRFYKKGEKRKREVEEEIKVKERTTCKSFHVPYKDGGKKTAVKRTSLNFSMDFSAPFKKGKFIEAEVGTVTELQKSDLDVRDNRMKARLQQENIVQEKKQVKPLRGSHLQKKFSERQKKWMEAVGKASPDVYSDEFLISLGVKEDVLRISVANAGDFKFSVEDYYGSVCVNNVDGIPAGDGCLLILDEENKFGVKEIKRAFLASPGVQPNLVPDGWVENHYKWLVWKFSHYERAFPRFFGGRCLNPNNVMLQLKYRYDREIDRNERSALKKILERDETSVKRIVLCICGIKKVINGETVEYELNLTDGWYSVPARPDSALTPFIEKEKLRIGTKLLTQGAVLVNCEQGTSPLQASSDVHLRIFTNSTRRVRWDTKLGFQKNPHNFTISLSSILPQGGQISKIDVIVVRIYPMLYMEKTLEGHSVTRNQRSEEKAELEYCRLQERRIEMLYDEMSNYEMKGIQSKKKVYNGRPPNFEPDKNRCDSEFVDDQNDNFEQSDHLDENMLEKFKEKLNNENLNRRNVTQFLRMKIVDYRKPDYNNPAILTVWNPNEEVVSLFSEGKVMSLMNVTISKSSRTYKSLQINTTRQTLYKEVVSKAKYPARQLTPLKEVASKICPVFEEVDLVGIVTLIKDISYGSRSSQIIYLADLDFHFVGIMFWGSPKDYGWENVLKVRSIVACSNLQWKKSCCLQEIPSLQVNESTVFTENPKHSHLKEEIEKLKENMPEDKNDFLMKCEEKLVEKLEELKWQGHSSRNSSGNDSIFKDSLQAKFRHTNGFESKPTASSTPIKPVSFSINSKEAEPSPIEKRIQKLQSYGEPPPLVPLIVTSNVRKYRKKC